jgi:hypothetical protein
MCCSSNLSPFYAQVEINIKPIASRSSVKCFQWRTCLGFPVINSRKLINYVIASDSIGQTRLEFTEIAPHRSSS